MNSPEPRRRGIGTLLILFVVCVGPFVASYLVYYFWPPQSRMNYGVLIPPRPLPAGKLVRTDGAPFSFAELKGRWVMLHIDSSACGEGCRQKLYQMRQVRLTQGKDMSRIERVWLLLDDGTVDTQLVRDYEGTHMVRASQDVIATFPGERDPVDHVYLVDPLGNLMLRFPPGAEPGRMKKDLERLLKVSKVG